MGLIEELIFKDMLYESAQREVSKMSLEQANENNYYCRKPMVVYMDIIYPDKYHDFFKYQIRMHKYVLGIFKSKSRAIKFMGEIISKVNREVIRKNGE